MAECALRGCRHIVLTGLPGVGKTTLVKNVCSTLKKEKYVLAGFYTGEMREGGRRIGFDVTTLLGAQCVLARVQGSESVRGECRVGPYIVDVQGFEQTAVAALHCEDTHTVMVIDEIGKMELFSLKFKELVLKLFSDPRVTILATVPVAKGRPIPFVEQIRSRHDVQLFEITKENRGEILLEILDALKQCYKCT